MHDSEQLEREHKLAIERLRDPTCRKVQYFLEKVREYWRPLPDLNLPTDPELLAIWPINPYWNIRIAPSTRDVETVAHFLQSHDDQIRYLAVQILRCSVPQQAQAQTLITNHLANADPQFAAQLRESLGYISNIDPTSDEWRTSRRSQA
jgi:hypothetical protein